MDNAMQWLAPYSTVDIAMFREILQAHDIRHTVVENRATLWDE